MRQTSGHAGDRPKAWEPPLLAFTLVLLLMTAWTARTWPLISHFRLPDNDDMMRLAQVRDWLGGQAFADVSQHRLGPPGGASMHWSRLADMGPAAIILALTPLLGQIGAEQAMLVLYPSLLFFAALLVGRRLALRLAPNAGTEVLIVLALTFPASSLFIPGRIDHHGLQILLALWFAERLTARPGWTSGAGTGLAAAVSLAVGLETLPLMLFGMAALFFAFAAAPSAGLKGERQSLLGFALALGGATLLFLLVLHPRIWPQQWCDGFTPASTGATLIAAGFFAILAALPLPTWRHRLAAAALLGLAALPLVLHTSSACLRGPYGAMDPLLQRLWMDHVGEARGIFGQDSFGIAFSYVALGLAGFGAMVWLLRAGAWRERSWQVFAILFGLGVMLTLAQIRATYVVSAFAAAPLAAFIAQVRRTTDRLIPRVGAWVCCTGVVYNGIGVMLDRATMPHLIESRVKIALCTSDGALAILDRLPPGRIIAPLDSAAFIIGGTRHTAIAAPYHRNNAGNLAMYRFFLGTPSDAHGIARQWQANYVVICRSSFAELGPSVTRDRTHLIGQLLAQAPPSWLQSVSGDAQGPLVYAIH